MCFKEEGKQLQTTMENSMENVDAEDWPNEEPST